MFLFELLTSYKKTARRASKDLYNPLSKPVAPIRDVNPISFLLGSARAICQTEIASAYGSFFRLLPNENLNPVDKIKSFVSV